MSIKVKRVYDKPDKEDGYRILVDRLWPRGLTKTDAKVDLWLKEIAPSNGLRKWVHSNPTEWKQFLSRYKIELKDQKDLIDSVRKLEKEKSRLTFLFASKNIKQNNAVALKQIISKN